MLWLFIFCICEFRFGKGDSGVCCVWWLFMLIVVFNEVGGVWFIGFMIIFGIEVKLDGIL